MAVSDELLKILLPHFQAYQQQGQDERCELSLDASVTQLKTKISSFEMTIGVQNLNLQGDGDQPTSTLLEEELGNLLTQFADAAIATENTNDLSDSVDRVLSHIAAFGIAYSNEAASLLLERAVEFSTVLLERVRGHACIFLGKIVAALMKQREENRKRKTEDDNNDSDDGDDFVEDSLAIVLETLIPRLQDKSQAVRCHAIRAAGNFFVAPAEDVEAFEEILEALQWNLSHDPSVSCRIAAVRHIPVHTSTVDSLVARVRDVKVKVRTEALEVLRHKAQTISDMTEGQLVDLIRFGLTNRCGVTKKAASKMVCAGWMKTMKFDPIALLKLIGVLDNEDEANQMLFIIMEAARAEDSEMLEELSDPEIRAFRSGIERAAVFIENADVELEPEQIFFLRARCKNVLDSKELTSAQKDTITSKLIPEIPLLCEVFEKHSTELIQAIQNNDEDKQDLETFICLQVIQLAEIADLAEEGSRRHFTHVMKDMLSSIETPDYLVEGCINALRKGCESEGEMVDAVKEILGSINNQDEKEDEEQDDDEEKENMATIRLVRILSILAVVLETATSQLSSNPAVEQFARYIVPSVTHGEALVREAAVGCIGKLGLFTDEQTIINEFLPLLLKVASCQEEALEIRAQSILAISDWSLLFSECLNPCVVEDAELSFTGVVRDLMDDTRSAAVCVSAEVAAKLLFTGRVCDSEWFAKLLAIYFDPRMIDMAEEDDDIKEVGSPVRLQQLLTLFFPAICMKEDSGGRDAMIGSILPLLEMVYSKTPPPKSSATGKKKTSRKKVTWPIAKMIQYVCSAVDRGKPTSDDNTVVQANKQENEEDVGNITACTSVAETEAVLNSTSLLASLQLAEFLAKNGENLTDTETRALCKILGATDLDDDDEEKENLLSLKELMEEVGMTITDATSLRYLSNLNELLDGIEVVEGEEEAEEEENEEEEAEGSKDPDETLSEDDADDSVQEEDATFFEKKMNLSNDLIEKLKNCALEDTVDSNMDKENSDKPRRKSDRKTSNGSNASRSRLRRLRLGDTN